MVESGTYHIISNDTRPYRIWITLNAQDTAVTAEKRTGAETQKWIIRPTGGGSESTTCIIENERYSSESSGYTNGVVLDAKVRGEKYSTTWTMVNVLGPNTDKYTIINEFGYAWTLEDDNIYLRRNVGDPNQIFLFLPV